MTAPTDDRPPEKSEIGNPSKEGISVISISGPYREARKPRKLPEIPAFPLARAISAPMLTSRPAASASPRRRRDVTALSAVAA